MIIRNASAVGQFYPRTASDIKSMLDKFSRRAESSKRRVSAAVSPHAGFMYCGETQAHVYNSIPDEPTTFVIIGPEHSKSGSDAIMTAGMWKTPLGNSRIDSEVANTIHDNSQYLEDDYSSFTQEHSIEVQLPWIQYSFNNRTRIVPITMNNQDIETSKDIGNAISKAKEEISKNIIVIASSDFTHFGNAYGYKPVSGGEGKILNFIEDIDKEAANAITHLLPSELINTVEKHNATICGVGPINAMIYSVKNEARDGELLHYSTSYEVSGNLDSIVGYCGIIIE